MVAAAAALIIANSPLAEGYFSLLHLEFGPLSAAHWINDALMALFFLLVGLEIKREMLDGQLATWPRRALPGIAAAGGMLVPALIYAGINHGDPHALRGWAIPSATDIAFAVAAVSLLGKRVPGSLKVFLTALAIIDDLGAVVIIALFYTAGISPLDLLGAFVVLAGLFALNKAGVLRLWPYLLLGVVLWIFVFCSGVHSTLAGVALALAVPLRRPRQGAAAGAAMAGDSPLHRLEHGLHLVVPFIVVPLFGFANAGVSFAGMTAQTLVAPVTIGIAAGLVFGKVTGIFGSAYLAIRLGIAERPSHANWRQVFGVALLCGIGFTMSLFIGLLAFADSNLLEGELKVGILAGSLISAGLGAAVLLLPDRRRLK